jgi:hypothetical protein
MQEIAQKLPWTAKKAACQTPVEALRRQGLKAVPNGIGQCRKAPKCSQTALSCRYSPFDPMNADGRPKGLPWNSSHASGWNTCGYFTAFSTIIGNIETVVSLQSILRVFGSADR